MGNNLAIRKLLLTTSAVACFALLLPLGASAAKAPPPKNLALTASPNPVVAGRATVLRGQLKGKDHANKVVTLSGSAYPFTTTAPNIATAVTDTKGDFSFLRRPSLLTRYTARAEGQTGPTVSVIVRHRVSLFLSDRTPRRGQRVRFSGRSCPEHDGLIVSIQRRTSTGSYRTVRRTRLRAASRCSVYSRRLRVFHDGTFRAVVAADASHAQGFSRRRGIDAHR